MSIAAATIHARDGHTGAHSDDVAHLCDAIADELGVFGHDRTELLAAAQLHDIGKVGIPHEVLEKPGPLDDREWALIHGHTLAGERIVRSVPELHGVAALVRHSHERWDGGGYPDGLSGEQIPLGSRIVFCADAFHAIRSDRPYRRGRTARAALDEVKRSAGSQFDPEVAEALVRSAGQMRSAVRAGGGSLTRTLRSRRVVSLLLALAVGGSALAAGLVRDESDAGAKRAATAAGSAREAGAAKSAPRQESPSTANRARRTGAGRPAAAGSTRRPDARLGLPAKSKRSATRAPAGGAFGPKPPTGAPTGLPTRGRGGRPVRSGRSGEPPGSPASPGRSGEAPGSPASPGRSGEAPRRPVHPGKPVGGAPGRSEEAPGRPSRPISPPAKRVSPHTGPAKPRGNANDG